MPHYPHNIEYGDKYEDDVYEYKNVILTESVFKTLHKGKFLNEDEWRTIGIKQSRGWEHYAVYKPEPWILLFRRPLGINSRTGDTTKEIQDKVKERTALVDKL